MEKICGVYLIVSPSGRRYIGSSKNIHERWVTYKRLDCKNQRILLRSFKKYGVESHSFKILYECQEEERFNWERLFGEVYLSLKDFGGLNHSLPKSDDKPLILSAAIRKQMGESGKKTRGNPEVKKRMSDAGKRRYENIEFREYHKKMQKIRLNKPELKKAASERTKNQFSNPEALKQMKEKLVQYYINNPQARLAASNKTKTQFQNTNIRQILSETAYKTFGNPETHPKSKKVVNINTGEIFSCAKIVALKIGMRPSAFTGRLRGTVKNNTSFSYL